MDTNKWKSVLLPRPTYEAVVALSNEEGRKLSKQLTLITESYFREHVPPHLRSLIEKKLRNVELTANGARLGSKNAAELLGQPNLGEDN